MKGVEKMENHKKSILFVCYGLGIGGIEKCLVNLVNVLPRDRYDVDVLLMNAEYAMKPQVREAVHFLDEFAYMVLDLRTLVRTARTRGGLAAHIGKFLRYGVYRVADQLVSVPGASMEAFQGITTSRWPIPKMGKLPTM